MNACKFTFAKQRTRKAHIPCVIDLFVNLNFLKNYSHWKIYEYLWNNAYAAISKIG